MLFHGSDRQSRDLAHGLHLFWDANAITLANADVQRLIRVIDDIGQKFLRRVRVARPLGFLVVAFSIDQFVDFFSFHKMR